MNTQNTVEQLRSMRLSGMANRYEAALNLPIHELQDVLPDCDDYSGGNGIPRAL